ncbi:heteromeric transposase endonuclease subunit TnsA [Microbulbifer sp. OS29]|uniref:Heteromeric transposase endonuclease subunit TnsA n=1 Tax=Microbulbifer okhotskensis TaxID=2926617 RepID=A0A9X2EMX7_9GAMM|nr:heteromeric transposase endonuclease subunit TnsA [Microbulbifer okhotskensis]MCO1334540.1 heteromeric transposase endonuclease subunit TnsA [Microbulbifer okhotskensis]
MQSIKEPNSCDKFNSAPKQTRKINPTRRSVSGQYAFRGDRAIPFESTLERDFLVRCEFDLSVLDVIPQPVEVPFTDSNGGKYIYTPDFLVYYHLGTGSHVNYPKPLLIEVKPTEQWRSHWRKWLPKWKAALRYAKFQGWGFHIYDESRIRDISFKNIRFLDRYRRMNVDQEERDQLIICIQEMGSCSIEYLLARYFSGIYKDRGLALIWHLLSVRKLECDISIPLNVSTELWVPEHG